MVSEDFTGIEVVLVSCSGKKLDRAAPARDLYQSVLFKLAREFAELNGGPWAILSARHGLVLPETVLEPYDATFGSMGYRKADRARWSAKVQGSLRSHWPGARFVFLAGEQYAGCVTEHHASYEQPRIKFDAPLEGLSVGERLSWLKREIADVKARRQRIEGEAAQAVEELSPVSALPEEVELAECDFCGEAVECAVSELGHQRFEGDDVPARICASCAKWALEELAKSAAVPA